MNPRYFDLSSAKLARLNEATLEAYVLALSRNAGAETINTAEATWYSDPSIISPMFNAVVRADAALEDADRLIDAAIAYCRGRGKPVAFRWGGPTRPADLGARPLARGLVPFEVDAPSMAADLPTLPERVATPEDFTIEVVRDAAGAQECAATFNTIYETPQFAEQARADSAARFGYVESSLSRLGLTRPRALATWNSASSVENASSKS
jgi:hypothetical protein